MFKSVVFLLALVPLESESFSFLALGDWGGGSDADPADRPELCVADGMSQVAERLAVDFVLALGDNFYENGVTHGNEGRFQSTFEDVFTHPSLKVEWWAIAGNHDHRGDVNLQIDYTKKSSRWRFPAKNYVFHKELPSGKRADFVLFDSVDLAGQSWKEEGEIRTEEAKEPGEAERILAWIESALANSTADYIFTACHYPVWSGCEHGPTPVLVQKLRPLLKKYRVTAHLAGHDHCLQHIEEDGIHFINSGAGSKGFYSLKNAHRLGNNAKLDWYMVDSNSQGLESGFAAVTLTSLNASVTYYGNDGKARYTAQLPSRTPRTDLVF